MSVENASLQSCDGVSVFLSYSRKDLGIVKVIQDALIGLGIPRSNVFFGLESMQPGDNWGRDIRVAIEDANICIFLWTNNIMRSEVMERERADRWFSKEESMKTLKEPYFIIDIVGEKLDLRVEERLEKYGEPYIQFSSKKEVEDRIGEKIQEILPLIQHIQKINKMSESENYYIGSKRQIERQIENIRDLASRFAVQYRYEDALELYKEAKKESDNHPNVLPELEKVYLEMGIGKVYSSLGRYLEAQRLYRELVKKAIKLLGHDHLTTLTCMNNLSKFYRAQGNYKEAEIIYKEVLEKRRAILGEEHPETLTTMNNFALICEDRGRYQEAEGLYKEVLEKRRAILGDDHPDTLVTINNLADIYQDQRRYQEAEMLYKEVLEKRRAILGENYPDTLVTMNNLARLYKDQGNYKKAETLYEEVLERKEEILGKGHPSTLTTMNNLARLYKDQGNYKKAETLYEEVLERKEVILGEEHPSTLTTMNSLAELYRDQGSYKKAEKLYKECEKREKPYTEESVQMI